MLSLFKRHPEGLRVLFGTEAGERSSFYGMRAGLRPYVATLVAASILTLKPSDVYTNYTSLVYLTPILGGMFADVLLGRRKAVIIGGILMAIGHFCMAFEHALLYALGFLVLGNGLFKGNITSQLKDQYGPNDPRLDEANNLFYMGVNIGSMVGILFCGALANAGYYHAGFTLAGVVMLVSLGIFCWGQNKLQGGYPVGREVAEKETGWFTVRDFWDVALWVFCAGAVIAIALQFGGWIYYPSALRPLATVSGAEPPSATWLIARPVVLLSYQVGLMCAFTFGIKFLVERVFRKANEVVERFTLDDWKAIAASILMCVPLIFFFAPFNQAGDRMNEFAAHRTDRAILGMTVPESAAQMVNPVCIVLVILVMATVMKGETKRPFLRQVIGMLLMAVASLVMMYAESIAPQIGVDAEKNPVFTRVSPLWIISVYVIQSLAEILIVPVALATILKLSPKRIVSTMTGVLFAAIFTGNMLSGTMGDIVEAYKSSHPGSDPNYWMLFAVGGVISALLLLILNPLLMRWGGDRLKLEPVAA